MLAEADGMVGRCADVLVGGGAVVVVDAVVVYPQIPELDELAEEV